MGTLLRAGQLNTSVFSIMSGEFPVIKSTHSLVAKHVTKERWDKVKDIETKTCGFTIAKACACAIEFDNQHCGIYAGDWDSYKDFAEIFDAVIQEYHGISADAKHTSDMDAEKIKGNIGADVPVHSTRIRVGRNVDGFGLSPRITKQQRIDLEKAFSSALKNHWRPCWLLLPPHWHGRGRQAAACG